MQLTTPLSGQPGKYPIPALDRRGVTRVRQTRFAAAPTADVLFGELTAKYGRPVPPVLLDLYDLAQQVAQEDRCVPRRSRERDWTRNLSLTVSVRAYAIWGRIEVQKSLRQMLEFTTGDHWDIRFQAAEHKEYAYSLPLLEIREQYETALVSEGSDSLCGILCHLAERSGKQLQGVHAVSQEERANQLSGHLSYLHEEDNRWFSVVKLPVRQEEVKNAEQSLRSRSFLLLTLAAIVAHQSRSEEVFIYENGLEAFNFPLVHHAEAERYSRIMHPIAVYRMERLINLLLPKPIRFRMPFLFCTKAEVIRRAALITGGSHLTPEWMAEAVSCHHFSARTNRIQCGICDGCILRRLALRVAEVEDIAHYKNCLFTKTSLDNEKDYTNLDRLYAGLSRLRRELSQVSSLSEQWECLVDLSGLDDELPEELIQAASRVSGVSPEEAQEGIYALYQRFLAEWEACEGEISLLQEVRNGT